MLMHPSRYAPMAISIRYYLFPEASEPLRLSQRLVEGLVHGKDAMPQYAGTRQKAMSVVVRNEAGETVQIDDATGSIWTFDEDGEIRGGLQEAVSEAIGSMEPLQSASATVVSIQPQLRRKRLAEKFRWDPSASDIDRVARDIWPKTKADRLKEAKGVSQRPPPVSHDAKHAIEKISKGFWEIVFDIGQLKEPSLKGFIFESRRNAKEDLEQRHLYEALAKIGEDKLEVLRRHKSGKGVWYAVVEVMHAREDCMESVRAIREKCNGRKAAVLAARRLLTENANLFDERVTLDARVMTDLEWEQLAYSDDN